jgi:hypothetical protein
MDNPKLRLATGHRTLTLASRIFELNNGEEGKNWKKLEDDYVNFK